MAAKQLAYYDVTYVASGSSKRRTQSVAIPREIEGQSQVASAVGPLVEEVSGSRIEIVAIRPADAAARAAMEAERVADPQKSTESSTAPSRPTEGGEQQIAKLPHSEPELPTAEEASAYRREQIIPLGVFLGHGEAELKELKFPELRKVVLESLKKRLSAG